MHTHRLSSRLVRQGTRLAIIIAMLIAALMNAATPAAAASISIDLYAVSGSTTLPGLTNPVTVWGYNTANAAVTKPGGPTLVVNQGDTVSITLHNQLAATTALLIQGQSMIPDPTGVSAGQTTIYTFVANKPGTFLYEAGLIPGTQHQVAMGLYGALIVRPAGYAAVPGQAYGSLASAFDSEHVLVLSELDTALNTSANPATFNLRNFSPKYYLINGQAYPNTQAFPVGAGNKALLRYVNAGLQVHSMSTLGVAQTLLGQDGNPYAHPHAVIAESIAPGQTLDVIVSIPASAAVDTRYPVYDASLFLRNNAGTASTATAGLGGMMTFLQVGSAGSGGTGDTSGPVVSGLSLSPNPTNGGMSVVVSATVSDTTTGNSNVDQAEFYIDGTTGTPTAMTGSFGTPAVSVSGSIPTATLAGLTSGNHTIYVRGHDTAGNWGAFLPATLNLDKSGPASAELSLSPNPSSSGQNVVLSATGSDTATGNSNVAAAEYWVDGGSHIAMSPTDAAAPVRHFTATIAGGLAQGTHVVSVRSQDSFGNWGAATTMNLVVGDTVPPTTSAVSASPNPNNGALPYNTSVPAVRVSASFSDAATGGSSIATAEGFIDTIGTTGTGFVFLAADGVFNSATENGYADVPLAVINALSTGNHTISVHARDAAGNWGGFSTTTLRIERTAPTFSSITLTSSTISAGTASVNLTVNGASDGAGGTGVVGGEYWINPPTTTAPSAGGGIQFTGTTASIPTGSQAGGSYTVSARIRDAAGNWSVVRSATLYIVQAVNDARAITANTNATQTSDANAAAGVLVNDQPLAMAGRTVRITTAPARTSGTGAGTITISCPTSLGTPATPAVGGNTVCTSGAYRVTVTGVGANAAARRASKVGTYQFTYTVTLNGVTSTATVTITVN